MREPWPRDESAAASSRPASPPDAWRGLIGEYRLGHHASLSVFERETRLWMARDRGPASPLRGAGPDRFAVERDAGVAAPLVVDRDARGAAVSASLDGRRYQRLALPDDPHGQVQVIPRRPVADVLAESMCLDPPREAGRFAAPDLVDVAALDPTLALDLRYATTNNFLGFSFYPRAIAAAQRVVAEAAVRAHRRLMAHGYGLVVLDAYRPWHVTKAFWDAVPEPSRWLVADPAGGSRHNRGAAIDVSLRHLQHDALVEMPSTFDEPTVRAYAFYPGGTDVQRWHRAMLREAMEREGFTVNPYEWWHFDHADWPRYRIENRSIAEIRDQVS